MLNLLAILIALTYSDSAHADPIVTPLVASLVVGAIGTSLAGTAILGTTVGALVTGGIKLGVITGVSLLLSGKRKAQHDPRIPQPPTLQTIAPQSISPRYYAAGRVMVGGVRHWHECLNGLHSLSGVILNCEPIDAVEAYLVDGENMTSVQFGGFPMLNSYTNGFPYTVDCGPNIFWPNGGLKFQLMYSEWWDFNKNQWVQKPMGMMPTMAFDFRNGLPEGNVSTLAQAFLPGLYSADSKCCNLACLYFMAVGGKVIYNRMAVYPRAWPEVTTIIRAAKIFDPRDPTQTFENKSTWKWSRNSVLVLAWYMTHYDGGRIPYSRINWDTVATEADYCDRLVPKFPSGTEKFAETDVQWHTGESVKDVMARLQGACDATVWEGGDGKWNFWIAKPVEPTITITDKDISIIDIEEGNGAIDEINYLTPSYTEVRQNYQIIPGAPLKDEESIAAVGERSDTITLKEVASFNQAHRLAYRALKRHNPSMKVQITGPSSLLRVIGEFVIRVKSEAANVDDVFRFVSRAEVSEHLESVTISLAKVDEYDYLDVTAPYDPVSPFETAVVPPPTPAFVQKPDAPVLNQVLISSKKYIESTARVAGATPTDTSFVYYAEYRRVDPTTNAPLTAFEFLPTDVSKWVLRSNEVTIVGAKYEFRSWFIQAGTPSEMSASSFITVT